jgi:hypothetical protein
MYIEPTTAFDLGLHDTSFSGGDCCAAGLLQKLLCVLPIFPGVTKRVPLPARVSLLCGISVITAYPDLQAIAFQRCLYHRLTLSSLTPPESYFHAMCAPKAHEVCYENSRNIC